MSTLLDLARLSQAVYGVNDGPPTSAPGWSMLASRAGGGDGAWDGLQAAVYSGAGETVVAFRGTTLGADTARADVISDLAIGLGANNRHFGDAGDLIEGLAGGARDVIVCGHSLGGAIAQVIGNRYGLKFATFNAPGVAAIASRNLDEMSAPMMATRLGGAALSAIFHPVQAWQDVTATFRTVTGVNLRLEWDLVSQIGVHYGRVVTIPGTGRDPRTQHGIATVIEALENNRNGALSLDALYRS